MKYKKVAQNYMTLHEQKTLELYLYYFHIPVRDELFRNSIRTIRKTRDDVTTIHLKRAGMYRPRCKYEILKRYTPIPIY